MLNQDYIRRLISYEQAAKAIDTVRKSELVDLYWHFRFYRKITPEQLEAARRLAGDFLLNKQDFARAIGFGMTSNILPIGEIEFGEFNLAANYVKFSVDPEILLNHADISKLARAGLSKATARLQETEEDNPELHIWWANPNDFMLHVPNRHYVHNPESEKNSSAPLWLHADRGDKSAKYCDRLNELLSRI